MGGRCRAKWRQASRKVLLTSGLYYTAATLLDFYIYITVRAHCVRAMIRAAHIQHINYKCCARSSHRSTYNTCYAGGIGESGAAASASTSSRRCLAIGMRSRTCRSLSRSISASTMAGDASAPASASTSPHGSTARACPYDSRLDECRPACAAASTKLRAARREGGRRWPSDASVSSPCACLERALAGLRAHVCALRLRRRGEGEGAGWRGRARIGNWDLELR